jgi:RES domain-containing protein
MRALWRIAADTKDFRCDDMSGGGAEKYGGRWNAVGTAIVYTSESRALAYLESIVHFNAADLPLDRYLIRIDVPDGVWSAAKKADPAALAGWDALPAGRTSIDFGTRWAHARSSALLIVPSVIVNEETNVLINPVHPDAGRLIATKIRKAVFDTRIVKKAKSG